MTTNNCVSCNIDNLNPINSTGNCDASVIPITPEPTQNINSSCVETISGKCPPQPICSPWDIETGPEECLIADYIQQQINIAGTTLKVHKLLGVHEQGLLQDVTGNGIAISGGDLPNNPASNAFDQFITEWKSSQTGPDVITSAFIGYDFGPIRLENGRVRFGLSTEIVKDISTIKIMQGCNSLNRSTKLRLERSENGKKWYGVSIINAKDCDGLITIHVPRSVPSRYWRLRPIAFNGGPSDSWIIRALQFLEYESTDISNIQDKILFENRDRDYQQQSIDLKATYTPQENSTQFDRWGVNPMRDTFMFDVSFNQCVQSLGRPFVIGDIVMVPSERQYTPTLTPVDKFLEITDVFWAATGFTPTWKPTIQKIVAKPLLATQESQDIMGKLTIDSDSSGLFDIYNGNNDKQYQDQMDISDSIRAQHKQNVPVKGIDYANVPEISDELRQYAEQHPYMNVDKLSRNRLIKGIDALPPNGLPFTEGDTFPLNPNNGDYHRLTYTNIGVNIPARLHRYSTAKSRWIYLETDRKEFINDPRPVLHEFIERNSSKTPLNKIDDEINK